VDRASTDPNEIITTYEGRHNHDAAAAETNSQHLPTVVHHR